MSGDERNVAIKSKVRPAHFERYGRSERPKYLEHHDLLVDVLWEELEDTVRELRALAVSTDQRTC